MIPHNRPSAAPKERDYIVQVLQSRRLVDGDFTKAFEDRICDYLQLPPGRAVAVSSGSAALYISLVVLNAHGKSVAMPSYVCSSLRQATTLAGARSNILDITPGFPQISQDALDQSRSDILINPYLYGLAAKLPRFEGPIIEDCAQALGASMEGNLLGVQADIGILSFYATKLLTSGGQGGMIISKEKALVDQARDFIHFDKQKDDKSRFNFSMTEIQAAMGMAQLETYGTFLQKRQAIWDTYQGYELPLLDNPDCQARNVRFRAVIRTGRAQDLLAHLASKNIQAIVPIEEWELLDPNAENAKSLCRTTVSLPIFPDLQGAEYIANEVREFLR